MDEIDVILISSVRPENSFSAAVLMYRHLVNRSGIRLHILPAEHHEIVHGRFYSKIVPRLMRTPARRWAGDVDYLMHTTLPLEKRLAAPPRAHTNSCSYTRIPQRLLGGAALREAASIAIDRAV